jgi:hypothetical protein
MRILERKGILEVEIIHLVVETVSLTEVVLEIMEIIPPVIWGIIFHSRRRIWPSMGRMMVIRGGIEEKVTMGGEEVGVMKNRRKKMWNIGMMRMSMVMITMGMVMRNLMMKKVWIIKIQKENWRVRKEIRIGEIMKKIRIWRRIGILGVKGMEIGEIGVRTEQVPPAALNKCRQE